MKKFEIENVLNPRKLLTHIAIITFCVIMVILNALISPDPKTIDRHFKGFILVFIQVELFIFLASFIFRNMSQGTTQREITRIVVSRFSLFLIACFVTAFIIILGFLYVNQFLRGGEMADVFSDFFKFEFRGWFKATVSGLSLGAMIFMVILWQDALKREQKLREKDLIFQNETLKNQVNPHFLFNSLNTLSSLIATQPEIAERFILSLSSIYRYILENGQKDKIVLQSELEFISDYFDLHKIRDEEKIALTIDAPESANYEILPVSLQILIENAIKHNMATRENPLTISIYIENQQVVVKNNLQKMSTQIKSTRIGLKNLAERVRLITGKDLIIEETNNFFVVKVPLLK